MENTKIHSFEAKQQVCAVLLQEGFNYIEGGSGKRSCAWERTLNDCGDQLQILVNENYIDLLDDNDSLCFTLHVLVKDNLNIEVVNHTLSYEFFLNQLRHEVDRASLMAKTFRDATFANVKGGDHADRYPEH